LAGAPKTKVVVDDLTGVAAHTDSQRRRGGFVRRKEKKGENATTKRGTKQGKERSMEGSRDREGVGDNQA